MRFSDAIALGRTLVKPKANTLLFEGEGCAQGMALCATGGSAQWPDGIGAIWPWTLGNFKSNEIPCSCHEREIRVSYSDFRGIVAHLFDCHVFGFGDWTLDQLIDWVRSVEPSEEAPSPSTTLVAQEAHAEVVAKHV